MPPIAALALELGDDAPASSIGQAYNLLRAHTMPVLEFLGVVAEARLRTREHASGVRAWSERQPGRKNLARDFFAVLRRLLAEGTRPRCREETGEGSGFSFSPGGRVSALPVL